MPPVGRAASNEQDGPLSQTVRRWLKFVVGLIVAAVFLWLLVRGSELAALRAAFAQLSVPTMLLALGFAGVGHGVRIVRWWRLLRVLEPRLRLAACVRPFFCGFAINNVLPFRAGDAFRALAFQDELRSPAMRVVGTLVIERVVDVIVVSGIFFVGLLALPAGALPRGIVIAVGALAALGLVALLAAAVALPWVEAVLRRLAEGLSGARSAQWAARHGLHLAGALRLVRSNRGMFAFAGLSVVIWACEGAAFVTVAAALGVAEPLLGPWLALGVGTLSTTLPLAPGHIGTFDYFVAQGLVAYGASLATATAFALAVHALWVPYTVAGLLLYWVRGTGARRRG